MNSAAQPLVQPSFAAHVALLQVFLARRGEIVERVQTLLNAQRKPQQYLQDVALLSRQLEDCFFTLAGLGQDRAGLKRQLDEAHRASGFKPRQTPGQPNDLVDAAELMTRAFHLWQRTRWPGYDGRARYAQTLFNLYLLRRLMLLAMRIWDADGSCAGERLAQLQGVLDELRRTTPADQPLLVRDARWLFPLAQSPTTDELHGYFEVAERIATTLPEEDRIEIHKASVRMAGGHLRSQLRHVATQKRVSLDDHGLTLSTRKSNALDLATLLQGLVALLAAYEHAAQSGDADRRLDLADVICQGISPDPELFVNRLDLLGPYSMIEYLFITTSSDAHATYTPMGQRHLRLLAEYSQRMARAAQQLNDDCPRFRPVAGSYSPYGVLYGFSSQLLEHMALKTLAPDAVTSFSLEDVFVGGDADKLAWVSGWRKLPHVPRDVTKLFEYPQQFAEEAFARVERALHERASAEPAQIKTAANNGQLLVLPNGADATAAAAPDLSFEYILSSNRQAVAENKARACDEMELINSRTEGEFLVSYQTSAGWIAISKDVLTDVLGAGRSAKLAGLPLDAARVLKLMCPELVTLPENG
jgi:hypothetical protein